MGDSNPSNDVAGVLCGYRRPQWRRGRGRRLAAPNPQSIRDSPVRVPDRLANWSRPSAISTPPPRTPATSVEGSRLPMGSPDPSFPFDFLLRTKMKKMKN
ncbi:hypothetical protein CRG98_012316 [Punica granatum]|uniref:Uncharacterized protein n=1 Tax=Punica granatum TaxID=22663 RepID=A0A2I0KFM3_PUNGR|nr:hypothetical protein CRG98_012316 [Punica granatum]